MSVGKYDHDRYFIGSPNEGDPTWEVGDRQTGNRIAICANKAHAVHVWRALIALDGAADDSLQALEIDSLRECLAENEICILDLKSELSETKDRHGKAQLRLAQVQDALDGIDRSGPPCIPTKRRRGAKA